MLSLQLHCGLRYRHKECSSRPKFYAGYKLNRRISRTASRVRCSSQEEEDIFKDGPTEDPERRFRRIGKDAGSNFVVDPSEVDVEDSWINQAPRIRFRTVESRQQDLLTELAMVNERLAGRERNAHKARQRLDYLRSQRQRWKLVYDTVVKQDAAATLQSIEEANKKVEEALDERAKDQTSVSSLKKQMEELQWDVAEAQNQLFVNKARVAENLQRINAMKEEAARLSVCLDDEESCDVDSIPYAEDLMLQDFYNNYPAPSSSIDTGLEQSTSLGGKEARNFWFPLEFSGNLKEDLLIPVQLFGEPWVLFRNKQGKAACLQDECAHRACPLSLGKLEEGEVQCPYHGWTYDRGGMCTAMPSTRFCSGVKVRSLDVVEVDGLLWVWAGEQALQRDTPPHMGPPKGFTTFLTLVTEVPVDHGLLIENLLDLSRPSFSTQTTKSSPSPGDMLSASLWSLFMGSGAKDTVDVQNSFQPPCITSSVIGLGSAGNSGDYSSLRNLHQMHVCLPSSEGNTRLLYRLSLNFNPWLNRVPGSGKLKEVMMKQLIDEEMRLVLGQQEQLTRGGNNGWATPVNDDRLGMEYRRWRNSLQNSDTKQNSE